MAKAGDKRPLGVWMCTALVIGNMIGSGAFLLPASLAPYGWNAIIGWLVTIGGAVSIAFVFSRLAPAFPKAGGPYAYARMAFGPTIGFAVAWTYWLGVVIGNAAIATGSVSYLSTIVPQIQTVPFFAPLLTVGVIWGFTLVNCLGARVVGGLQVVATILKIVPFIVVLAIAIFALSSGEARPTVPLRFGDLQTGAVMATAALTLWSLVGLESATVPADKVHNPQTTIPRATLYGTIFAGLLYLFACSAVQLLQPQAALASSAAPFADFLMRYVGGSSGILIAACAAFSGFFALNGWVLLQGELPRAMAEDGIFPRWFARTNAQGTPIRAYLVSSSILTVTVMMNYEKSMIDLFTFVALLATTTALVAYLFTSLAALWLQRRADLPPSKALAVAGVIASAYSVFAIIGAGTVPAVLGAAFFILAIAAFLVLRIVQQHRVTVAAEG